MAPQPPEPDKKTLVAAVLAITPAYIYFLIFAQFGFLHAARSALGDGAEVIRPLMGGMGVAGITGSMLAARGFTMAGSRRWLIGGFAGCGLAAIGALGVRSSAGFLGVAVLTGLGAGVTTVTLAGLLRPVTGGRRLGLIIGLGTGLAYGFCNLPGVIGAEARTQALIALGAAALGMAAAAALAPHLSAPELVDGEYSRAGITRWVIVFMALVCLDSALFYSIQNSRAWSAALWGGPFQELLNAGTHLTGALLGGWALDRGRLRPVVLIAGVAIVGAAWWFTTGGSGAAGTGLVYMAGVSAYSTAIVFYPARSGRPALGALLYAVAGWTGSGLGIGLVAERGELPPILTAALASFIGIGLMAGYLASRRAGVMNENFPR